jgi:predicted TPR repeat methyltransferase
MAKGRLPTYGGQMATLPPERQPDPAVASHRQRQVAESFGAEAERYDRARPGYPAALVDRIVAASPGPDVLDAGCGTGISSRLFRAAGGLLECLRLAARAARGLR